MSAIQAWEPTTRQHNFDGQESPSWHFQTRRKAGFFYWRGNRKLSVAWWIIWIGRCATKAFPAAGAPDPRDRYP